MTALDEAVAWLKTLPEDDQERAARALAAFACERSTETDWDELDAIEDMTSAR